MADNFLQNPEEKHTDNLTAGAKGGAVALILQVTATGLGFLNQIAMARLLGAGGIGEVILALTVVNVAVMLAAFGMQGAMIRFVPFYAEKGEVSKLKGIIYFILKFCFAISIIFSVMIWFFSKNISINIFHSGGMLKLLLIAALAVPANVLNDVIGGMLKGYKETFKALLPQTIISPFFRLMLFMFLCFYNVSAVNAIVAFIAGELLALVFLLSFLLLKINKDKPEYKHVEYKKVFDVATAILFTGIGAFIFTQADLWIVGVFVTTEAVGVYGVVSRLVALIAFSLSAFSTIIPPIISAVHASGDRDELRRIVRESTRWSLSAAVPIILILILEGKFILKYAYGGMFADGYAALVILCVGQLINVASGLAGWLLQMTGGHKAFMRITFLGGVLNIILNIILVPKFGIIGAACVSAFTLAFVNISSVFVIYNKMSVITLARGLKFDVVFGIIVAVFYFLFSYSNFHMGYHFLLAFALVIYIWRSIVNGDLPVRILHDRYRTG